MWLGKRSKTKKKGQAIKYALDHPFRVLPSNAIGLLERSQISDKIALENDALLSSLLLWCLKIRDHKERQELREKIQIVKSSYPEYAQKRKDEDTTTKLQVQELKKSNKPTNKSDASPSKNSASRLLQQQTQPVNPKMRKSHSARDFALTDGTSPNEEIIIESQVPQAKSSPDIKKSNTMESPVSPRRSRKDKSNAMFHSSPSKSKKNEDKLKILVDDNIDAKSKSNPVLLVPDYYATYKNKRLSGSSDVSSSGSQLHIMSNSISSSDYNSTDGDELPEIVRRHQPTKSNDMKKFVGVPPVDEVSYESSSEANSDKLSRKIVSTNQSRSTAITVITPKKTRQPVNQEDVVSGDEEDNNNNNNNDNDDVIVEDDKHVVKNQIKQKETDKSRSRLSFKFTQDQLDLLFIKENPKEIFTLLERAGEGSFGQVYIAKPNDPVGLASMLLLPVPGSIVGSNVKKWRVAIKVVSKVTKERLQNIANEIKLMEMCSQENIVRHIQSYKSVLKSQIWIVLEYCDGGSLRDLIRVELKEKHVIPIVKQIVKGLTFLHSKRILHRDIKSDNILLNIDGTVKIADLGLAIIVPEDTNQVNGICGSKYWMAPEVITGKPYSFEADIWSLGCVCIEMITCHPPYHRYGSFGSLFHTAIYGKDTKISFGKNWSLRASNFLDRCFEFDQHQRPSSSALLEDKWINDATASSKDFCTVLGQAFAVKNIQTTLF
eukprot:TRINITY_DN2796_c0_g1_i2.p1 TRINITY_DN2796_c0_g1~~TRINITY_DN2796_c0_g1_i2.p1  ORF type:complete len:717 (+),score=144.25 TRINITY_DN2796_c0_g1_i2:48-2198(+)